MYVRIDACMYVRMYVFMHVCMLVLVRRNDIRVMKNLKIHMYSRQSHSHVSQRNSNG